MDATNRMELIADSQARLVAAERSAERAWREFERTEKPGALRAAEAAQREVELAQHEELVAAPAGCTCGNEDHRCICGGERVEGGAADAR